MRALAVTGWSGSGKTTLLVALIKHCVARGERVAAIKHTHHEINDRNEGDTARFLEAGASQVILTNDREAIQWGTAASVDVVLIEGFKSYHGWPRIDAPMDVTEAITILDRIAPP